MYDEYRKGCDTVCLIVCFCVCVPVCSLNSNKTNAMHTSPNLRIEHYQPLRNAFLILSHSSVLSKVTTMLKDLLMPSLVLFIVFPCIYVYRIICYLDVFRVALSGQSCHC